LDRGIAQFEKFATQDKATNVISGSHAFMLYDTFGFPVDLTLLMAEEKGMTVDNNGYEAAMAAQKAKSRGEAKEGEVVLTLEAEQTDKLANELSIAATVDSAKYEWVSMGSGPKCNSTVKAIWTGKEFKQEAAEGDFVGLIFDQTNFYAEAGGQLFDTGRVSTSDGVFSVGNVQKFGGFIMHSGTLGSGSVKVLVCVCVYERERQRERMNVCVRVCTCVFVCLYVCGRQCSKLSLEQGNESCSTSVDKYKFVKVISLLHALHYS